MPNRQKQHPDHPEKEAVASHVTNAENLSDSGGLATSLPNPHSVAGEGLIEPPQQLSSEEIFSALSVALSDLETSGARPMAAGVSARMRTLDPSFSLDRTPYKTFRRLLLAAEATGLVKTIDRPDNSDVEVWLSSSNATPAESPEAPPTLRHLNDDLWKAMMDWSPTARYVFNRKTCRTSKTDAALFESTDNIEVDRITKESQLVWMHSFAQEQEEGASRQHLTQALQSSEPVQSFGAAIKLSPSVARKWKRYLQTQVLQWASRWADANSVALKDIERAAGSAVKQRTVITQGNDHGDQDIRARIFELLELLPTSDLLRLPIPVEYALRR
ncbi:UPF0158 family protein [Clavibacter sp. Sh2141]|uniref:UPF0158 family protein n=1 Tax=Clavibacter sp. Sh2141 TaxID=3395374 RepID=UPI0039BC76AC